MIRKEISIGFISGILSNLLGIFLYILLFSDLSILASLEEFFQEDQLGILIASGAVLNFVPFFYFLKKNKTYRARGVLMASFLAALGIAALKIL